MHDHGAAKHLSLFLDLSPVVLVSYIGSILFREIKWLSIGPGFSADVEPPGAQGERETATARKTRQVLRTISPGGQP